MTDQYGRATCTVEVEVCKPTMSHADVRRVEEIRTSYEVNRFLELGWVLLQVFPAPGNSPSDRWPYYIMGWAKEEKPNYPPN